MEIGSLKEINHDYIGAVYAYEKVLQQKDIPPPDVFVNLSFLYWAFASQQIEFNIPNKIPDEWSLIGGKRFSEIISTAVELYPDSLEIAFWKKYYLYRLFGESFSEQDCITLIERFKNDKSLVPYFYLYVCNKSKYTQQMDELLNTCKNHLTAKNIYIMSFGK